MFLDLPPILSTMVKKRNLTLAASATTSGATAKATSNTQRKSASEVSAPAPAPLASEVSVAGPAPGDWPASTTTKRGEKKARSLGIISTDEGNVILPVSASRPSPPVGFTVMFMSFLYRGLSLPAHEFLRRLLHVYEIQLWQLTPNSILHLAIFITLCEAFLGIEPHFGLWKKIFFVKCYNCSSSSFVTGGVGFVVRKEVNYFNFPMRESVQGWRLKWIYIKDSTASNMQLPKFVDVLKAVPKRSWKNILSAEEKPILLAPEHFQDTSDDNLEERSSSIPVESRTEENVDPDDENNDHVNPEAFSIDPRSFANDTSDTAESNHDDDADHADFVDAATEKANVQPSKRSSGGFADEDNLYDLSFGSSDNPSSSIFDSFSLSKGKEIPSTTAITASPPPGRPEELERLRNKLKDEDALKTAAEAQRSEKDNLLR
ncbi:hypothetical protein QYE76_068565 [Lolium multiflorum]|uniref:Transposase (putative) gypsy type domain-containing protein n=1 Tax=Lolium multiflorum TaxID=4521 RepID=A0AAD8SGY3_LOLMU|nr:hypothetical protein QYE76_068565 [Lolium multiflorum]